MLDFVALDFETANKFKNIKTIGTNLTSLKFLYPDILIPRYSN